MKKPILTSAIALALSNATPVMADWASDALSHQSRLQKQVPLVDGIYAGTHNSYSSNAYNLKLYENQDISITAQLNAGARILELDIYRTRDVEYGALYLCHSSGRCSTAAGTLSEYIYFDTALREIATWAKANPDQVLLIKIENGNLETEDWVYFREGIQMQIGDIVYRPEGRYSSIPSDLTPKHLLDLGKQILFFGWSADKSDISKEWMFQYNGIEEGNEGPWSNCSKHAGEGKFSLFFEQRDEDNPTPDTHIRPNEVSGRSKCGGTWFGFDWLSAQNDARMKAAVWSWAENQPDAIAGTGGTDNVSCAVSHQGRFYDDSCGLSFKFACENPEGEWKVTTATGPWSTGESQCQSEFGDDFRFSVPKTSKQNEALKMASALTDHWVNYSKGHGEHWLSGEDRIALSDETQQESLLKAAIVTDYTFNYSDEDTDAGLNLAIYRPKLPGANWYMLGDTPAFAADGPHASGYARHPGQSIVVYDDGSGKLADPIRYDWKWNDWKTGGKYDITFWHPVAPSGYTCLGDVAIRSHDRSRPNLPIKCVRDDLLVDGQAHFYWNDNGSGGEYNATAYLTIAKGDANVNHTTVANTIRLSGGTAHKVLNFDKIDIINGPKAIIDKQYTEIKALGKCIEPSSDAFYDGLNVQLWDCNTTARQKWAYDEVTGFIRNQHNPLYCLDSTGATGDFDSVTIYQCTDHINLKWSWTGERIKPQVNSALSLDVLKANSANGTDIIQYQDNNSAAQVFTRGN
ncbi:ricin-type beta-trefoil lectin domain protein [Pseudoalteromonas piscicida]|uniref:ricin-type beta-trefoil lectin domain protein n=1 Tax=Pseudoalteromonas piscicida TaxID=43662 RepID=UPI0005FA2C68|nr:ricin-type beta-trefoil lectin domain protein [Pseudoalteromonas piscicida]KJZ02952.1 hypothetical protein TW73_10025 [Pseudoalteromonas piscicida]